MDHLKEFTKRNGYYVIGLRESEEKGTELVITVYPPLEGGKALSFREEKPKLAPYLPGNTDWQAVSRAFENRKGLPEPIALLETGSEFNLPGFVFAGVSKDALSAWILYTEPLGRGEPATAQRALEALEEAGVVYGLDRQAVESVLRYGEPEKAYLVAKGTPAVRGEDARIEYLVNVGARHVGPRILIDGSVDYKNVIQIDSVTPGQAIARKIPAGEGVDGTTVTGEVLKSKPGRDRELKLGRGVQVSPRDPLTLEANTEGEVSVNRIGLIEVREILEVRSSVNYSTGNVSFKGNIVIYGDVASGFRVEATGDVRVTGTVEAAEIVAGGDVTVHGGFLGHKRGSIRSSGNVTVAFVQSGRISAGGNVIVTRGILNSKIDCGGELIAEGTKGVIMGGEVLAECGVKVTAIGSEAFTPTVIRVGMKKEVLEEFLKVNERLHDNRLKLEEASKGLKTLEQIEQTTGLDEKKGMIREKLLAAVETLSRSMEEDERRLEELDEIIKSGNRARIVATKVIYPGAQLFFSTYTMKVTDPLYGVAVVQLEDDVAFFPLEDRRKPPP